MKVDEVARAHRALSDEMRLRLFGLIAESERPLDIAELARALDLHPNTIRAHLRRLEDASLVTATLESRATRGRPRRLYEPGPAAEDVGQGARDYRLLATILAGHARAGSSDPAALAEAAGRSWGGYLSPSLRPKPGEKPTPDEAIEQVTRLMADLGFKPDVEPSNSGVDLRLHNCPFRGVAEQYPDVICALHLGLLKGSLEETTADVEVTNLVPFVSPSLCVSHLSEKQT